jgi:membrane protease YdiL (CAAX protease family)
MPTIIENPHVEITQNEINKPWSAKATLGLTLLIFILYFIISIIVLGIAAGIEVASSGLNSENTLDLGSSISQQLALDGDFNAINYMLTALCLSPLIFYFAKRKKISTAAAYLGFDKRPNRSTFINFNLAILAYFIFSYFASSALAIETPQSMISIYNSTDYLWLLFIAVVIIAPIFEELLFRGFIYKGLESSPLGIIGTIIITSVLFTLIHSGQYDLTILTIIFPLAIIIGLARYCSGGIYLPIYLHFANNLYSAVHMHLLMN